MARLAPRRFGRRRGPDDRGVGDRGTGVVELVALAPVYFAFISLGVFVGQLTVAYGQLDGAARSAARTVSLDRSPTSASAREAARDVAADIVDEGSPFCTTMAVPALEFRYEDDVPVEVTVTVRCRVDLSQASGIGIPGSRWVESTATEVIDRYREQR